MTGFLSLINCSVDTSNTKYIRTKQPPPFSARGLTPKDDVLEIVGPWSNACVGFLKEGRIPDVPVPYTVA